MDGPLPPVDLYLISEKSIWKNQVQQTGFLVYFELNFYCLCSLQKSILKLIFAGYTGSEKQVRNSVCRTWFFQIDFSEIKYRSTEGYSSKNELILHFLKFCNEGDLIFYYVASGIFWCMQSKNALQRQREGIDSKTGIQGILVSSCSYWHMHAVQWQQGEPNKIRDNFWKICISKLFLTFPVCFYIQIIFSNLNCSNLLGHEKPPGTS